MKADLRHSLDLARHSIYNELDDALVYVFEKFLRDFALNLVVAVPIMYAAGEFKPELFFALIGPTAYRTWRDVRPVVIKDIKMKVDEIFGASKN